MGKSDFAEVLIKKLGGVQNVKTVENCMTRLRIEVLNPDNIKTSDIKTVDGVIHVVKSGNEIQVVLGPGKAQKMSQEVNKYLKNNKKEIDNKSIEDKSNTSTEKTSEDQDVKLSQKIKSKLLNKEIIYKISKIFVPLVPGLIGCGILKGLGQLLLALMNSQVIPTNVATQFIQVLFSTSGTACMSFITVFVGINCAKVWKCSTILGGIIGALVMMQDITNVAKQLQAVSDLMNLNLTFYDEVSAANSLLSTGKGGIIGVMIGVWLLSKLEAWLHKHVPNTLDLLVTSFTCVLVISTFMFFIILPISGILTNWIASGLSMLSTSGNIIVKSIYGFLLGALFLPLVVMGVHQGLIPIYSLELVENGYITMLCPIIMAGFAQCGVAICIYIKSKAIGFTAMAKTIAGTLPAALLGVAEPLIYSMTLPMAILFVPVGLGAGCAGIFVINLNIHALSFGPSGLLAASIMTPESILPFLMCGMLSMLFGFLFTFPFMPNKKLRLNMDAVQNTDNKQNSFDELVKS